ncbi:MAG: histidine kinase dimerization/phospho-acceptor domain-containing protein, partial [Polyangiales bacterium]
MTPTIVDDVPSSEPRNSRTRATSLVDAQNFSRLTWLTGARMLLYALLLVAIPIFYLRGERGAFPYTLNLVVAMLACAFFAAGVYAFWLRTRKRLVELAWTQIVLDQLIWSALVYLTGGPLSFATTFYGLSCVLAAVTLGFDGAIAAALLGGALYVGQVVGFAMGWIRPPPDQPLLHIEPGQLLFPSLVTTLALLVVSLLAAQLALRLQTESGRLKEVTERAERAERLAALGRIAAALAHEIRNPLGSIAGSIDLISESPGLGDDERRLCTIVRKETERLNDLVSDMMDLARPRVPTIGLVDLARVASDVVQLATQSGRGEHDVPVRYEGPDSLVVSADAAQLRQVIWNLLRNAVQATAADAEVVVRVALDPRGHGSVEV